MKMGNSSCSLCPSDSSEQHSIAVGAVVTILLLPQSTFSEERLRRGSGWGRSCYRPSFWRFLLAPFPLSTRDLPGRKMEPASWGLIWACKQDHRSWEEFGYPRLTTSAPCFAEVPSSSAVNTSWMFWVVFRELISSTEGA